MDLTRITLFTLAAAVAATAVMVAPGLFLAWLLARYRFRGRVLLDTLASLPLVMPPVASTPVGRNGATPPVRCRRERHERAAE